MMDPRLAEKKIEALLHDPPGKAPTLWYRSHEGFAAELVHLVLGREPQHPELVVEADRLASAVDRNVLVRDPVSYRVDFLQDPQIVHPLSGTRYDLGSLGTLDLDQIEDQQRRAVEDLARRADGTGADPVRLYWYLWRGLGDALSKQGDIGKLWRYLPADTRNPDHSIWDHMALTSAFAGTLPEPALLVFSFGPVQGLIAAARRTGDLWAGSFLLSWLAWKAMEGFVAEWGGDAILFPDLRGQPLMDAWLGEEVGDDIPGLVPRSPVASLPNRFLALVPAERAEGLARQAETDLRAAVGEYATTCVGAFVEHYSQGAVLGEWVQRAVREAKETVSCHWYVLPWQGESDGLRELSERVLGRGIHDFWCTLDGLRDVAAYRPNRGTYFAVQSALVEAGHGAVKASRPFGQFGDGETARRCTVCGTGGGLWDPRGRDAPKPGRALKEGEALCGLCAARRQAPKSRWAGELCGETIQFPSTHNLAASRFMENVLDCIARVAEGRGAAEDQGLVEQLRRFVDRVSEVDRAYASPWLFERAMGCGDADLAAGFVKMPAELLVPESYGDEDTLRELGFAGDPKAAGIALSAFLGACAEVGISRAGRYYAAMVMDGDRMGQWLSGQLAPEIGEVLHEGARPPGDPAYLRLRRPLSSAHQVAVSRALNEFSLGIVRPLVERVHGGVVVYAGGDDLLALLPLHRLIPCLRDLRRLYSGLPLPEGSDASKRGYEAGSGFVRRGGRLWRVMGEKATCSMGVAIAHQKWPLRHALETARSTEKYAKESLGRNAVTIALLKRSGGYETFGARWGEEHGIAEPDPLAVVDSVVALIREDLVSRRFAYALHEEAPVIWHLPGALEERAYWLIDRHWRKRQRPFNRERALAVARGLAGLADRLKAEKPGDKADVTADGRGAIPRFQAALGLAEFIGRDVRGGAV